LTFNASARADLCRFLILAQVDTIGSQSDDNPITMTTTATIRVAILTTKAA
jgi:hypothetical protein